MKIAIVCYPTFGGSGVVATELGLALADHGHEIHFITYKQPRNLPIAEIVVFAKTLLDLRAQLQLQN